MRAASLATGDRTERPVEIEVTRAARPVKTDRRPRPLDIQVERPTSGRLPEYPAVPRASAVPPLPGITPIGSVPIGSLKPRGIVNPPYAARRSVVFNHLSP